MFDRDRGKVTKILGAHRALCRRTLNGVPGRAHGWCVDFVASANELIKAGLALPEWFKGNKECKRVLLGGREIEVHRQPFLPRPTMAANHRVPAGTCTS